VAVLRTEALCKAFAGRVIFEDVALELERGEALALMGASGSGKTTLLRCLNGLELADRGVVTVGDARIVAGDSHERLHEAVRAVRRRVGFVFQDAHLFSHRTVLENVMEGPRYVKKEGEPEAHARALSLLAKVGVAHRAGAYPRELSGGEQQRAASRARARDGSGDSVARRAHERARNRDRAETLVALFARLASPRAFRS